MSALAADDSDPPDWLDAAYGRLSKAILEENMPGFMPLFHRDYLYEGPDGAVLDRGPWRRRWLDNFDERDYATVAFEVEKVLERSAERVSVRVRRVVVESSEGAASRLEETVLEDTWTGEGDSASLIARTLSEVRVRGGLVGSGEGGHRSARLARLSAAHAADDDEAVAAWWASLRTAGAPMVEPVDGDPSVRLVTFMWRGTGREAGVSVRGGRPSPLDWKPLERLAGSTTWYRSEILPADARFVYAFRLESAVALPGAKGAAARTLRVESTSADPLNPRVVDGASLAELPASLPVRWIEKAADRARGKVKRETIRSKALGERRFVSVYTPPGFKELSLECAAAFVLDGGTYSSRRTTATVLDNLIAEKKLPPSVVFMIHDEGSLRPTLEASPELVEFLVAEVLPWARKVYSVSERAEKRVIGGSGPGGAIAAFVALAHPKRFGGVLLENADLSTPRPGLVELRDPRGSLTRSVALGERLPLEFVLDVGALESPAVVSSNRHLRDVLEVKGYATTYRSSSVNRHATTWHAALAHGLTALLGAGGD